MFKRDKPSFSG